MANKIVELRDKDDNNLLPVSGGILTDSIDTNMLSSGAVTFDKIDFSKYMYKTIEWIPENNFIVESPSRTIVSEWIHDMETSFTLDRRSLVEIMAIVDFRPSVTSTLPQTQKFSSLSIFITKTGSSGSGASFYAKNYTYSYVPGAPCLYMRVLDAGEYTITMSLAAEAYGGRALIPAGSYNQMIVRIG